MKCLKQYIFIGIVIYGPATALSSLTDLSTEVSIALIGIIATFYTVCYIVRLFADIFLLVKQ